MNIAVLSGKGGTGKTTVSTNLSFALQFNYVDCDVEEPNGFIFLNPNIEQTEKVYMQTPVIDKNQCTACGACVKICQFNALAQVKQDIVVFEKLCHSCGACQLACKYDALAYKKRSIGKVEKGSFGELIGMRGVLDIGEPMAPPVIRALLKNIPKTNALLDCPPGTSCNVVNTLKYAQSAILVTEPSKFGLHDLIMAIELVKMYKIPFGIIINKDDGQDNMVVTYCKENHIKLLGRIPYDKATAVIYSQGDILYHHVPYKRLFDDIAAQVKEAFSWN